MQSQLEAGLQALGLPLSAGQKQQLLAYTAFIAKWNKVYNLTAIKDPAEVLTHHLLDSLAVIAPLRRHIQTLKMGTEAMSTPVPMLSAAVAIRVLDVGAGAGLPGVVIAICCPDVSVVCVDAVGKKAAFIQQVAASLDLKNLKGLHARVEAMLPADVQPGFDVITSRAFASLADFTSLTAKHLAEQGIWMAMKAKMTPQELTALPAGVRVFHVEPLTVPSLHEERCLVWLSPARA